MARPEEFKFESHCCGISGTEDDLTLICKVCPPVVPGSSGFEIRIEGGDFGAAADAVADHVHSDPLAKPCHRVIQAANRRKALEV